jgi:23S rRNA methylase
VARSRPPDPGDQRLNNPRRRTASSRRWLERQLRDPYVAEARRLGYRSRAAFKLIELDDRFHFLKPGLRVIDLGAAPGGWTQVAVARVRPDARGGQVVAVDLSPVDPIAQATIIEGDIGDAATLERLQALLAGPADVVLSDMAPPATGHASADHLRIMGLAEEAFELAKDVLAPGGAFVCKVWQGGTEPRLLQQLKQRFSTVRHAKPPASRAESAEMYVLAQGFRDSTG